MLHKTKIVILALSLFTTSGAMAASQQSEGGYIPIDGIFVEEHMDAAGESGSGSSHKAQTAALAGLLMSVFVVIGTGRAYSQLHSKVQTEHAVAQKKHVATIQESVKVHDSEFIATMEECESLRNEIADLQSQLSQVQQEA